MERGGREGETGREREGGSEEGSKRGIKGEIDGKMKRIRREKRIMQERKDGNEQGGKEERN